MNIYKKPPGKYDEIWSNIKNNGECTIKCSADARKSIIQGVKRAKFQDIEFKFANEFETLYLEIFCVYLTEQEAQEENVVRITFKLRQFPGIEEIVVK